MIAGWWRRLRGWEARDALAPLYRGVVATARRPVWYRAGGVPDTLEGRFDMVSAILTLVLLRLEREGEAGKLSAARLTELFVDDMDGQLRQQGVGDIVVGKHIGKMMGVLGGKLGAFRVGFASGALDDVVARNLLRQESGADPAQVLVLRDGLLALRAALDATPVAELLDGAWQEERLAS